MTVSSLDNLRVSLKRFALPRFGNSFSVTEVTTDGTSALEGFFTGVDVRLSVARVGDQPTTTSDVVLIGSAAVAVLGDAVAPWIDALPERSVLITAHCHGQRSPTIHPRQIDEWRSPFGPSFETIRTHSADSVFGDPVLSLALATPVQNSFPDGVPAEVEVGAGAVDCYRFLEDLHRLLEPRSYAEIGVEYGASLKLAACPALGIDPAPQLSHQLAANHSLCLATSDDYFFLWGGRDSRPAIDLSYIDGMHQIEFALKDFMYLERSSHPGTVSIVDDIYPAHPVQGERIRRSRYWTGDIWKIIPILRQWRPELVLAAVDTEPTGSLLVAGLDPGNDVLWNNFDTIIEAAIEDESSVPTFIVERHGKIHPESRRLRKALTRLRKHRDTPRIANNVEKVRRLLSSGS